MPAVLEHLLFAYCVIQFVVKGCILPLGGFSFKRTLVLYSGSKERTVSTENPGRYGVIVSFPNVLYLQQ
jgi:hypothetical protein